MRSTIIIWIIVWAWLSFVQAYAGGAASVLCGVSMIAVVALVFWEDRNRTSKGSSDE